jgi:hypothetical protein
LIATLIAWTVGMLAVTILLPMTEANVSGKLVYGIGLGSGMIAILATLPGVVIEARDLLHQKTAVPVGRMTIGFSLASAIRVVGTLALVGMCRYQMPADINVVAVMALLWYGYLTTVDIVVLSRLVPRTDTIQPHRGARQLSSVIEQNPDA